MLLLIIFTVSISPINSADNIGYFWHITDLHWDMFYTSGGLSCEKSNLSLGNYGNYYCDPPWNLITDAIDNMYALKHDVDFVLWTGDNTAHIPVENLSTSLVLSVLENTTRYFKETFQDVPVYASLGNHDLFPPDLVNASKDVIYDRAGDFWQEWIKDKDEVKRFKYGGYYSVLLPSNKVHLIVLNTNLYHNENSLTKNLIDPGGQFKWLKSTLSTIRKENQKAIITGHIPPGSRCRGLYHSFQDKFHTKFINILTDFSDIILSSHYGHEHGDSFRILQNTDQSKAIPQFIAPSITPVTYDTEDFFHNPGFRLVTYNRDNGSCLDYKQFYTNLTLSNSLNQTNWKELYEFRDSYNVPDMSVESLRNIYSQLDKINSTFQLQYCQYYRVTSLNKSCPARTQAEIYCAGMFYDYQSVKNCVRDFLNIMTNSDRFWKLILPKTLGFLDLISGLILYLLFFLYVFFSCKTPPPKRLPRLPKAQTLEHETSSVSTTTEFPLHNLSNLQ